MLRVLGVVIAMGIGSIVGVVCGKGGRYIGSTRGRWDLAIGGARVTGAWR